MRRESLPIFSGKPVNKFLAVKIASKHSFENTLSIFKQRIRYWWHQIKDYLHALSSVRRTHDAIMFSDSIVNLFPWYRQTICYPLEVPEMSTTITIW